MQEYKIRAMAPVIITEEATWGPYYSIRYFDLSDKSWHTGFSSSDMDQVKLWLMDRFFIVPVTDDLWEKIFASDFSLNTKGTGDNNA